MNNDTVWEVYYTDTYAAETRRACRDRITWLRSRARGRVLDVGCSQGVLPILLGRDGHDAVGVDVEEPAIGFAQDKLSQEAPEVRKCVRFVQADIREWGHDEEPFDTIVLGEVLEHVAEPRTVVDRVQALLAPKGRLLVTVPFGWLDHHDHKHALVPTDLVDLVGSGFNIEEIEFHDSKIHLTASASGKTNGAAVEPMRLLREVEAELVRTQHQLSEATKLARRRRDELLRLQRRLALSVSEKRALPHELTKKKQEVVDTRHRVEGYVSYRLGKLLLDTFRAPWRIVRLPDRLIALAIYAWRRKRRGALPPTKRATNAQVYSGEHRVAVPGVKPIKEPRERRILHVLEYSLPHQQNGYTVRSRGIIKAQREHGWDPVVVTKPGFPDAANGAFVDKEKVYGTVHHRLTGGALSSRSSLPDYLHSYVMQAARVVEHERPFIVHAASDFRNAYAAMEIARNFRLPFVYEVRGLWEETRVANGDISRTDAAYTRFLEVESHCMRAADAIVTLGSSLKSAIVERAVDPDKIFLVPNAVDAAAIEMRARRKDLIESLELDGKFVLAYIGSVTGLENLQLLLRALVNLKDSCPNMIALVVGDGTALGNLKEQAQTLGVAGSIRFVGKVPYAEVADYYALVDAIVCTRGKTRVCELVTPLKPFEAMGYRKPLIVPDLGALREIVKHEETGLLYSAEDSEALAAQIVRLVKDPELAERMSERAHAWVTRERSWKTVTANYQAAYSYAVKAFQRRAATESSVQA